MQNSPRERRQRQKNSVSPGQSNRVHCHWICDSQKARAAPIVFVVLFWNVKYQPSSQEQCDSDWRDVTRWLEGLYYFTCLHIEGFTPLISSMQQFNFPAISSSTDQSTPTASVIMRPNVQILSRTSYCVRNAQGEHSSGNILCRLIICFVPSRCSTLLAGF